MTENWLQRTIDAPDVIAALIKRYGVSRINEIAETDAYKDAQAVMAMALTMALEQTNLSKRKRRAAGVAILDQIMTGAISVFMLGWQACEANRTKIDTENIERTLEASNAQ